MERIFANHLMHHVFTLLKHIGMKHVINMSSNPGHIVTIYQFSHLFATAWKKAMIPSTIVGGFKTTGIFPLNRHAIVLPGEQPGHSNTPTALLAKKKGIQYMSF